MIKIVLLALLPALVIANKVDARTLCTIVVAADSGRTLVEEGDCDIRATPASTFKIPLAVMGFDSGFLTDAHSPELPFKKGYPDWLGDVWRQPTDPARWIKHSVVWYSQRITQHLGAAELRRYTTAFGYGNADASGDPGKDNGLERSWISSSLKISPREQAGFMARLVNRKLPVAETAIDKAMQIVEGSDQAGGWRVSGKTGGAYPRNADGTFDRSRGWGWYVGWATRGGRTVVFARLAQDERREKGSPGIRTRESVLKDWQRLAEAIGR